MNVALRLFRTTYCGRTMEGPKIWVDRQNTSFVFLFPFSNLNSIKIGEARSTNTLSSAGPAVVLSRSQTSGGFLLFLFLVSFIGSCYVRRKV
jgi:hypothetical protein